MKLKKVIITGGPGTGKTSIIKELKKRGYFCYDEIWDKKYENPSKNSKSDKIVFFSERLFYQRLKHLENKHDIQTKNNLIFFDRSIIDTISYLITYKKNIEKKWIKISNEKRYYKNVFLCPSWKNIFKNTDRRKETFNESILIEKYLKSTYKDFGYDIIEIPKDDIKKRVDFILKAL